MNVSEAIQQKRAVRLFTEQPLPQEIIEQILDAGRRSQSAKNSQPWEFIVVQDPETRAQLSVLGEYMGHAKGAAMVIVFVGLHSHWWGGFDIGQCAAYMQLAAMELGIGTCIGTIDKTEAAKALLGVPQERVLNGVLSFGYPSPEHKPYQMGGRRPLDEVTHPEKW